MPKCRRIVSVIAARNKIYAWTIKRGHACNVRFLILIKIQRDATVCSLIYFTAKSLWHVPGVTAPIIRSTKVIKTVTAASGTGHNISTDNSLLRGQVPAWPRWREVAVAVPILWPVPEAAVTVFSTLDGGCSGHPEHVEWFCSKNKSDCILLHLLDLN